MFDYQKVLGCLFFAAAILLASEASPAGDGIMPFNRVPGQIECNAQLLTQELEKQGFEVLRGYFKLWQITDCDYTAALMGSCYGNNPAAPYVITTLPPWPEEYVDTKMSNIFGPSATGYHDCYRFDPREAIVVLGQMPPQSAYFSEQTWLFTRQGDYNRDSQTYLDIQAYLPPFLFPIFFAYEPYTNNQRIEVLSSLSNIVNNVVIERKSGKAFDQIRHFIVTPDGFMEKAVRNAFAQISVKDEHVFTERIPSNMKVGLEYGSDDFTTWFRYAHPDDTTAADKWRNDLPMVVLRVRDRSNHEMEKYPPVVLEERTAVDEHRFGPDLGSLMAAVGRRWAQPCANFDCSDRTGTFIDLQTAPAWMVGPMCTAIGENCLLDTQDTAYQIYGPMPIDNGEIYAVAGTLGTQTGNATYVGFGINQLKDLKGVWNLSDELKNTAKGYGGEVCNTDKLFLYYFTRDCSGLETLTDKNCLDLNKYIPQGNQLVLSIRDYIAPRTQRGPESSLVLPSRVLQLVRPNP